MRWMHIKDLKPGTLYVGRGGEVLVFGWRGYPLGSAGVDLWCEDGVLDGLYDSDAWVEVVTPGDASPGDATCQPSPSGAPRAVGSY